MEGRNPGFAGSLSSPLFRGTDAVYLKGKVRFSSLRVCEQRKEEKSEGGLAAVFSTLVANRFATTALRTRGLGRSASAFFCSPIRRGVLRFYF